MKDFFKWFKSGTKIKRWIFLIIVGIVLVCYGINKALIIPEVIGFKELAINVLLFVFGFTFTIVGIVCIQRRTLEMMVEATDTRKDESANKVNSLIFNRKVYNQGPKVVVIGGGAGLNTVLKGLKNYTDNITAIVTISDYGETGNKSRRDLGTLPLDDIKESLIALATNEQEMSCLLNLELNNRKLEGLKFADIYLTAMKEAVGDFARSVEESCKILNMTGRVLPVTLDQIKICAELEDGTVVESKDKIPEMVSKKVSKISRIYISPTNIRVAPGVIEAIKEADAIVLGPGSLYTNVIPNLLVKGVSKAIKESKAFKIYVSNIMTEPGQTYNYSLTDHIRAIKRHMGEGMIDYCIYDTGEVMPEYIRKYNMQGSELVEQDIQRAKNEGIKLIKRDLATVENGHIRHNPDAIAGAIIELVCEDLKFKDKQNDPEYLILSQKLKYKKINPKKKNKWKKQKLNKDGKSKFYSKYENRIMSIRESDEKLKRKIMNEKRSNQILEKVSNIKKYNTDTQRAKKIEEEKRRKIMNK